MHLITGSITDNYSIKLTVCTILSANSYLLQRYQWVAQYGRWAICL